MKKTLAATACLLALAAPAVSQPLKDAAVQVREVEAMVTVVKIDAKAFTATVRGPSGNTHMLNLPPESQNLDRVKPGDVFKVKYIEAVAVAIRKGGAASQAEGQDVRLAAKGANPGGMVTRTRERTVVIDAVDYTNRYVAVRGTGGVAALKVADGVPLDQLSAGDTVTITHTEALALEAVAQPAKKPAAKKAKI